MMIHTINMPALSPTMETGKLEKWMVKKGDSFRPGDVLCEIETDKAIMEVEAVDEGFVHELLIPEKTENIKVNSPILTFTTDDDKLSHDTPQIYPEEVEKESPDNRQISNRNFTDNKKHQLAKNRDYTFSSPLARRIAQEHGADLSSIVGSGPHGRIIKKDVELFLEQNSKENLSSIVKYPDTIETNASAESDITQLFAKDSYESIPHNNMRKTIASRLQHAKQTIPHFYVSIDCNIDNLLSLRAQMNAQINVNKETSFNKISVNDVVLKAFALAMVRVPEANVSWTSTAMLHHKNVDISVAVSIPDGIITPIIRKVDQKSILDISSEVKILIQKAKKRNLKPEEYQGGTTSVSNMGMFGIKNFCAIVNPPQSTMLAVGAGEKKPIFQDGQIKIATIMNVTLSADHRSVDGAMASKLLSIFKEYVENPIWMLM
ncbi:MAG: pyruvate dehydrogenase complex dihydrolipoamide acetyltransferase [Candidatus Liberibacter europaeus]|uniref:Acetyltransferase component of pyruvate dehydrogenase complex n=1 Tax=Candidatus Liberibacter europaeus TaxID=744859 RepID=A0A2T4VXS4_9HYPH|nr:pyruvate dehydrogenase complex dihydrolipoamide acetyltransferase [Candidatus Liberibacter europaeus]PTL86577.1 MAG: pyruvate dehydrogenase complex dihydrolipoamide acetyltransferase [Candidatus Liberibacter europaeus]